MQRVLAAIEQSSADESAWVRVADDAMAHTA